MKTLLKLHIEIGGEAYTDICNDPREEFFNTLGSIKGLKYTILPYEDNNENFEKIILERGLTKILIPKVFCEATGTPYDSTEDIIVLFKKFLDRIIFSNHLILVDRFIFSDPNEGHKHSDFITQIFSDYLKKLQKITFITSNYKFKKETEKAIFENFKNIGNQLELETKFSNLFHDRFWLCGEKGLFVGTSLNGVGKRYFLIDYISPDDILDIKKYFLDESLI